MTTTVLTMDTAPPYWTREGAYEFYFHSTEGYFWYDHDPGNYYGYLEYYNNWVYEKYTGNVSIVFQRSFNNFTPDDSSLMNNMDIFTCTGWRKTMSEVIMTMSIVITSDGSTANNNKWGVAWRNEIGGPGQQWGYLTQIIGEGEIYETKIEHIEASGDVIFSLKYPGDSTFTVLLTAPGILPFPSQYFPAMYWHPSMIMNGTSTFDWHSRCYEITIESDYVYTTDIITWPTYVDLSLPIEKLTIRGTNWPFEIIEDPDVTEVLTPEFYQLPLPSYNWGYSYGGNRFALSGDLYPFASAVNNFEIGIEFFASNTPGRYVSFEVNGIEILLGAIRYWPTNSRYLDIGVSVDGVVHAMQHDRFDTDNISGTIRFSLVGNRCRVWYDLPGYTPISGDLGGGLVYDESDFLGSPAEYISKDFLFESGYMIYDLYILWIELGPIDLAGWLDSTAGVFDSSLIAFTSPPILAKPGYFFHRTEITGGGENSLDGLDPTNLDNTGQSLTTTSSAIVITDTDDIYLYKAYEEAGAIEAYPDVIVPDNNPGDWYWGLVSTKMFVPAKQMTYTDLSDTVLQPFDNDHLDSNVFTLHRQDSDSVIKAKAVAIPNSGSGIKSDSGALTGKTSVIAIPRISVINRP